VSTLPEDVTDAQAATVEEAWLCEAPALCHRFPAAALSALRFDAAADMVARVASALSRMPAEARTVDQFMRLHGEGYTPLAALPPSAGSSGASRESVRDGLRAVWVCVLGERLEGAGPLLDDVPFGACTVAPP
jgi:hypothetical protein